VPLAAVLTFEATEEAAGSAEENEDTKDGSADESDKPEKE